MPLRMLAGLLALVCLLAVNPPTQAQELRDLLRTNKKFLATFAPVVKPLVPSVARIRCDGANAAMGVVVDSDGLILTKAHDLKGQLTCVLSDESESPAKIVGVHPQLDLALLRIRARNLRPITFAPSAEQKPGTWVASVGLGELPVAVGVISVATREIKMAGLAGLADPSKAGYLGISLEPDAVGVRIAEVLTSSPAARAGLRKDDVILRVDDVPVVDPENVMDAMLRKQPGESVTLRIRRDGADMDLQATLGPRPAGSSWRSDFQNRMGSTLSARRTGYPMILQHDTVLDPADCGSPLVTLDGQVLGLNITRAGRVETWAIPSEAIIAVLVDLKSGRLAPASVTEELADRLVEAMRERLLLMRAVAQAKHQRGLPIRDAKREAQVLAAAADAARAANLDEALARRVLAAQIEAACTVQEAITAELAKNDAPSQSPDLATVRKSVDAATEKLMAALVALSPHLDRPEVQRYLRSRAETRLSDTDIPDRARVQALDGLIKARD